MDVSIDVEKALRRIPNEKKARTAVMRSLNDANAKGKTAASKAVRSKFALKAGDIASTVYVIKAGTATLTGKLLYKARQKNMINYNVKPKKIVSGGKGKKVSAGVLKNKTSIYNSAFVQNVNGLGLWKRTSKDRLPIKPVYGPASSQLMRNKVVLKAYEDMAAETFNTRFEHHFDRAMK